MPKLYYFQAPTFTINPESETAPKLGSIFSTLDRLTTPLNQLEPVHVPENLKNKSASTDFHESVRKGFGISVALNANIARGIAGTTDVVYAFARDKANIYRCGLLETEEFEATEELVRDAISAAKRVQNVLENALPGRKRVYMITGLKIATGAFGAPVEVGPNVELATLNTRTVSQGRSLNKIIFAYRVVKVKVKRDGEAKFKYKSGGKYAEDDVDSDEEEPWDMEALYEEDIVKEFPNAVELEIKERAELVA
ncbi:hypothetical protein BU23DRAFT_584407 [Bimuria novae-zelandiae CBS 107.79]|uniref:Uncharacterized protein n=1 Tax=Bimuria novae-zelandiae CBS 107.79 TaxID=1447943 RepID=A0A6A5UNS4_9PLEO|nr:hypothetical protein BU23DRAFT_584407 [Bimuria novae-zelandiae CBS 107.79]